MQLLKIIFGAILGAALGFSVQMLDPSAPGPFWFAIALPGTAHLLYLGEELLLARFAVESTSSLAALLRLGLDLAAGALTGIVLGQITTAPILEAAGLASLALFLETLIVDKLLIGNAAGNLLVGMFERGLPPEPQFSLASAMAARGDYAAARTELERSITAMPGDPRPLLALARMQRFEQHDPAAALQTLERVLRLPRLQPAVRHQAAREVAELREMVGT